jgi:sulfur carrier protein ThiS
MKIWVNDQPVDLLEGMTVRHALIQLDLLGAVEQGRRVVDEWGNQVGLDGAVEEGQRFEVKY